MHAYLRDYISFLHRWTDYQSTMQLQDIIVGL